MAQPAYEKLPETVVGKSHLVGNFAVCLYYLNIYSDRLMWV
jgi:hypothetical protein